MRICPGGRILPFPFSWATLLRALHAHVDFSLQDGKARACPAESRYLQCRSASDIFYLHISALAAWHIRARPGASKGQLRNTCPNWVGSLSRTFQFCNSSAYLRFSYALLDSFKHEVLEKRQDVDKASSSYSFVYGSPAIYPAIHMPHMPVLPFDASFARADTSHPKHG